VEFVPVAADDQVVDNGEGHLAVEQNGPKQVKLRAGVQPAEPRSPLAGMPQMTLSAMRRRCGIGTTFSCRSRPDRYHVQLTVAGLGGVVEDLRCLGMPDAVRMRALV